MFSKDLYCRHVKARTFCGKGSARFLKCHNKYLSCTIDLCSRYQSTESIEWTASWPTDHIEGLVNFLCRKSELSSKILINITRYDSFSIKRRLKTFAKSIDSCQPAHSPQVDMGRTFDNFRRSLLT